MDRTERPVSDRVLTAPVGCGPTTEVRFRRVEGLGTVPPREVEDQTTWLATLQGEAPLHALRLQGLDLTEHRDLLLARDDLSDLVIQALVEGREVDGGTGRLGCRFEYWVRIPDRPPEHTFELVRGRPGGGQVGDGQVEVLTARVVESGLITDGSGPDLAYDEAG